VFILNVAFVCAVVAIVAFVAYRFVGRYRAAEGTTWQKLLHAAEGSATMLSIYASSIGTMLLTFASKAGDALGIPQVREFVESTLQAAGPEYVGGGALVILALIAAARLRSIIWPD
jgi:hypothetical protein